MEQCDRGREGRGKGGAQGRFKRAHFPLHQYAYIHTHTLKRIYGRLRAAIDKIICLFDPLFNSIRKGVVCVRTPIINRKNRRVLEDF